MKNSLMKIAPGVEPLQAQLISIEEHFSSRGTLLHNQRNVIKQFVVHDDSLTTTATDAPKTINIVVKSFKIPTSIQGWIYAHWRPSKARRSFEYAKTLQSLGINTHRPLAYSETIKKGKLRESYFFSELIDHDFTIRDTLNQGDHADLDIIRQFTAFTYSLHKNNILHLDHSPGNTLVKQHHDGYRFAIVDINRMKFQPVNLYDGLKNFSRLSHNLTILQCIANCYAEYTQADPKLCYRILCQHQHKEKKFRARKQHIKRLARQLFDRFGHR